MESPAGPARTEARTFCEGVAGGGGRHAPLHCAPERRPLLVFITLIALLWQGVAGAGVHAWAQAAGDAEHAALHLHDVGHHHDADDGTFTEDDSPASALHLALDGTVQAALQMSPAAWATMAAAHAPPGYVPGRLPAPVLDPFQRPPRSTP